MFSDTYKKFYAGCSRRLLEDARPVQSVEGMMGTVS